MGLELSRPGGWQGPASLPRVPLHPPHPGAPVTVGAGRRRLTSAELALHGGWARGGGERSRGGCRRQPGEGEAGPEVPRGRSRGRQGRGARHAVAAAMGACRHLGLRRLSVSRLPCPGETGLDLETERRGLEVLRQERLSVTFLLPAVKPGGRC